MLVELLLNGLVQGSLLALICIGYSLAYGTARVLNFAHADVMIAGGGYLVLLLSWGGEIPRLAPVGMGLLFGLAASAVSWTWFHKWKVVGAARIGLMIGTGVIIGVLMPAFAGRLPFLLAMILVIPCAAFLAAAVYQIIYLPLIRKSAPRTSILMASFGASIALQSLLLVLWGSQRRVFSQDMLPIFLLSRIPPADCGFFRSFTEFGMLKLGMGLQMPVRDALIIAVFVGVSLALALFFRYSRLADAIVATADDRLASEACGIPIDRVLGHAFLIGGAIASLGGTFYVLRSASLDPMSGFTPGILAFVACVLGGIGSLRGSIAGAFLVGIITSLAPAVPLEKWASQHLSEGWLHWLPSLKLGDWSYGVIYLLMILIILFKPRGLFAR